jgi:histidinol-phosphate/aromatic aminotransferase/cobyric acid decarboxylase-like protein/choline kinase
MSKKMQAIILAAGFGKRMRPLSYDTHKTLLEINGVSILANIVDKLIKNDVKDVTLVLGYQAKEIEDHMKIEFPDTVFNYVINERYAETNNLVSLSMGLKSIENKSDVIIIESDLIYDESVLLRLLNSKHDNVALVDHYGAGMDGTVVSIDNEVITSVIPPHLQGSDFTFKDKYKTLNIYKFTEEFCFGPFSDLLEYYIHAIKDSYYELILGIIIYLRTETIHAEVLNGEKWTEIDDPNDLQIAKYMFEANPKAILDKSYGGFWNYEVTDFCYLRNMYFPPASMMLELKNNLDKTIYEYGSSQTILNRKMSYFLECDENHIVCVNGISQLFPFMRELYKEKSVLIPSPTFGDYHRVFPDKGTYSDTVGINLKALENASEEVIIFVNPNNPTGTTLPSQELYDFAASHKDKMIIVDESFIDFCDEVSIVEMLKSKPLDNVVIFKSLSKCLGVAGLRIGFCYTHNQPFLDALNDFIPIWNMNTIAENFLEILLKYRGVLQDSLEHVKRDRADFHQALDQVSYVETVYPSGGDYLLATLSISQDQEELLCSSFMNEHKIYLKPVKEKFNDGKSWFRFAVHQPRENERLVKLMSEFGQDNKF